MFLRALYAALYLLLNPKSEGVALRAISLAAMTPQIVVYKLFYII